ncbi:MAG: CapA family protein [Burkholderiales bacterium]
MIDAGADAVVGAHPHVTQEIESYRGKPIVYSLGNFVFDGFTDAASTTGWLLRLEVDRGGVREWRTVVAHVSIAEDSAWAGRGACP